MDTAAAVFFLISLVAFDVSIRVHSWFLSFFVYFVYFVVPPPLPTAIRVYSWFLSFFVYFVCFVVNPCP